MKSSVMKVKWVNVAPSSVENYMWTCNKNPYVSQISDGNVKILISAV